VDERVELFRDVVCIGLLAWIAYDLFSMVQNNKLYPTVGYVSSILYVAFALCIALMFIPKDLSEPSDKEKEVTKNELSEILQKGNALSIVGTRVVLFGFVKSIEKEKVLINVGDTTEIGIVDEIKDVVEEKIESVKRILEEENSSSDSLLSNNSKKDTKVVPAYLKFAVDELPYNSIKKGAIIRVSCISRGFENDLLVFDMCKFIQ
jgi:preprotein translocase subunit YajC